MKIWELVLDLLTYSVSLKFVPRETIQEKDALLEDINIGLEVPLSFQEYCLTSSLQKLNSSMKTTKLFLFLKLEYKRVHHTMRNCCSAFGFDFCHIEVFVKVKPRSSFKALLISKGWTLEISLCSFDRDLKILSTEIKLPSIRFACLKTRDSIHFLLFDLFVCKKLQEVPHSKLFESF